MSTPRNPAAMIAFYQAHLAPWQTNATSIGLAVADVTDLEGIVEAAQTAAAAQETARQAAKTATAAFHNAVKEVARKGAGMIGQIRGFARSENNPAVYTLAQIPGPKTPTPVDPPGMPNSPQVLVQPNGDLTVGWRCKNPPRSTGTVYEIRRSVNGGVWQALTTTGKKSHTDTTLPAGASQISYQVQAVRSTQKGVTAQFDVRLGTTTAGPTATAFTAPAVMKAA